MTLRLAVPVLVLSILACGVCAVFAEAPAPAPTRMTNDDVVKLVKMDLGDDLVTNAIRRAPSVDFRLDTDGLAALKSAGVSNEVIKAMFARTEPAAAPVAPPPAAPAPPLDRHARCLSTATEKGSAMSGRTTTAFVDVAETDSTKVLAQLEAYLKSKGKKLSGKKGTEIWVDTQPVIEEMKPDTLRLRVQKLTAGSRVEGSYEVARGTLTHYDVNAMLCNLLIEALPEPNR